jgi:hypothetical protein
MIKFVLGSRAEAILAGARDVEAPKCEAGLASLRAASATRNGGNISRL